MEQTCLSRLVGFRQSERSWFDYFKRNVPSLNHRVMDVLLGFCIRILRAKRRVAKLNEIAAILISFDKHSDWQSKEVKIRSCLNGVVLVWICSEVE
uniref:SFRICE_035632 n=1 Tax=Spodoptera frugiperda TaxID=7108 RepID=A0A2H1VGS4_SPOFR